MVRDGRDLVETIQHPSTCSLLTVYSNFCTFMKVVLNKELSSTTVPRLCYPASITVLCTIAQMVKECT